MVLIETLWNVKQWMKLKSYANSSINRNIVECKEMSGFDVSDNAICINRNIVECKDKINGKIYIGKTCINSNIGECKGSCGSAAIYQWSCINRNIVECKEVNYHIEKEFDSVLIETLWNVKVLIQLSIYKIRSVVLIETLWNVKFLTQHLSRLGRVRINRNIVECKDCCSKSTC